MPKYKFTCQYCNHKWEDYYYSIAAIEEKAKCGHCGDTVLRVSTAEAATEKADVYGYNTTKAKPDAYVRKGES